ncbi:MAG: hypothetical protein ACRECW_15360 [Phyllobacterium sp.]
MTDKETPKGAKTAEDRRKERLSKQLRANLARRKAQSRARRAGEEDGREGIAAASSPKEPDNSRE